MKIVKFENGKYGVRAYWLFGWRFLSMSGSLVWSSRKHYITDYCQGTLEEAENARKIYSCKYTIVE